MAAHSCIWYIRNLNFFPQLNEESMELVAMNSHMVSAKRGEMLSVRNTLTGHVYLLKQGHMRVVRHTDNFRAVAIDVLAPGDLVGLTPILTEDEDVDAAEALEDVLLCRLPAALLREVLEHQPGLALHYSKLMGLRRRRTELRLADIAFSTVKVRLARLIQDLASRFGQSVDDGTLIRVKLTHQELADMIGSNREAANRAMSKLIDDGAIKFNGKHIVVSRAESLEIAANEGSPWQNVSGDTIA
jgi:CRP/FNR family transcriptional regulator